MADIILREVSGLMGVHVFRPFRVRSHRIPSRHRGHALPLTPAEKPEAWVTDEQVHHSIRMVAEARDLHLESVRGKT
jgi:hypothetical protein